MNLEDARDCNKQFYARYWEFRWSGQIYGIFFVGRFWITASVFQNNYETI